jgi:hypothetical protein
MDTILITARMIESWKAPPCQRRLRINEKVRKLSEQIKASGGVIPGIIHLAVVNNVTYLLDGQHRMYAFSMSGSEEGYADVCWHYFDDTAEMGIEFDALNSRLVAMKPDDHLRAQEESSPYLQLIRKRCPFIGYDNIRRSATSSPVVSMSAALRCWFGSRPEVPTTAGGSCSQNLAGDLTEEETENFVSFMTCCFAAWGRDAEYHKLWGGLTVLLSAWLYRRTVISQYSPNSTRLGRDVFTKCLMSLSANKHYVDWIVGRLANSERDRSPAYTKLKAVFTKRVMDETGKKPRLPAPAWQLGHTKGGEP